MGNFTELIEIITPDKLILKGFWIGPSKPRKAFVFIHGLTADAFSNHKFLLTLADQNTALLFFSNRGSTIISKFRKIDKRKMKGYTSRYVGEAHEVFTECRYDIQGAVNFIRSRGVNEIYLVGHSTGCQKSIYYLAQKGKQKQVSGVVLLCPISDYSAVGKTISIEDNTKAVTYAQKMVELGKAHDLLPPDISLETLDAQRYLSLYTPDSEEEIFTYCQSNKKPIVFRKVKGPMLIIFAEKDEYRDRSTKQIVKWFKKNTRKSSTKITVIKNALHGFNNQENEVAKEIHSWLYSGKL